MIETLFSKLTLFITVITIVGTFGNEDDIYRDECLVWDAEIKRIYDTEPRVKVKCKVNAQCTGFDCSGNYTYNSVLTGGKNYEKAICFGLWINPCSTPTVLTVYLEQKSDNISFTHTFTKDGHDDVNVPGFEEEIYVPILGKAGTATVTLEADVYHLILHGKPYMTIGVKIKPKVNYGGVYEEYPSDMQVALVNDVDVPVPNCDKNVPVTVHKAYTCVDLTGAPTPATLLPTPKSCPNGTKKLCGLLTACQCINTSDIGTLYVPCKQDIHSSCESLKNGGCLVHDDKNTYYCDCAPHFQRVNGMCAPKESVDVIPIITEPPCCGENNTTTNQKPSIPKSTVIIVSCTISAIVIALAAAGFVFWKYRAHHERYGGHQLLANNEDGDDDDVPPINLET